MRGEKLFMKYQFDLYTRLLIFMMLFVIGGISGWLYEMGFYRINFGYFVKRGHGFGPWLPIYGFGCILILLCSYSFRKSPVLVVLICALVTGLLEFATGYVLYHYHGGLRLWDYNTEIWNWGNIGGYVCFRSVAVFALAGALVVYFVFPWICFVAKRFHGPIFSLLALGPFLVCAADIVYGYFAKGL